MSKTMISQRISAGSEWMCPVDAGGSIWDVDATPFKRQCWVFLDVFGIQDSFGRMQ